MGTTHFRSDVKEHGSRTASFSTISAGSITSSDGITVSAGKYIKLGSIYFITGAPSAFTLAGINAVATNAIGVSLATSVPRGSLFINASVNVDATHGLYFKVAPATWSVVTTGSEL